MTLIWRDNAEQFMYESGGITEIIKSDPSRFITKGQKYCDKNNPETYAKTNKPKNLQKIGAKPGFSLVVKIIANYAPEKEFTTKDIVKELDAIGLTDGGLQRQFLHYLVCNGIIKQIKKELDKKEKGIVYWFVKNTNPTPCPLLQLTRDKKNNLSREECGFDWKTAKIKQDFNQ